MDTQKMQSQLYRVEEMPEHFHELYIESGYRSPYSTASQCIKSIFLPTNETLNVWTHLMPGLYFWWVLYLLSQEISFIDDPYMWPMFAYMVSVCLFPIASALAHIFNTMSDTARHTCFFIDYMALSLYSLGAAIAYNAYIFPKVLMGTTFAKWYLPIAVVNAVVSMVMMCETRFMEHGIRKKILRLCSLGIPYMFDSLPVIYRIVYCEAEECDSNALWLHTRQFGLAFSAAALYSSHMPERLRPGVFDIIGHSHQLFHICSVLGSYDQMRGLLLDAQERRVYLLAHVPPSTFSDSVGLLAVVAVIDLIILLLFTRRLCLMLQSVNNANYSLTHHKIH